LSYTAGKKFTKKTAGAEISTAGTMLGGGENEKHFLYRGNQGALETPFRTGRRVATGTIFQGGGNFRFPLRNPGGKKEKKQTKKKKKRKKEKKNLVHAGITKWFPRKAPISLTFREKKAVQ